MGISNILRLPSCQVGCERASRRRRCSASIRLVSTLNKPETVTHKMRGVLYFTHAISNYIAYLAGFQAGIFFCRALPGPFSPFVALLRGCRCINGHGPLNFKSR